MKKKIMMVAALAGILSLAACVDDNESASVEAVRNAKAEQLKSLAALNNANAEAALIVANAQKALAEAKAAYQTEQTEEARQKFAIEIERIKAQAEAEIAQAKANAAQYEQLFLDQADAQIQRLYGKYSNAINNLNDLNRDLLIANATLAESKANLITTEETKTRLIASENESIEKQKVRKAKLQGLTSSNKAELSSQIEELRVQRDSTDTSSQSKNTAFIKAYDNMSKLETANAAKKILDDYSYNIIKASTYTLTESDSYYSYYTLVQSNVLIKQNYLIARTEELTSQLGVPTTAKMAATGLYIGLETAEKQLSDDNKKLAAATTEAEKESYTNAIRNDKVYVARANEEIESKKEEITDAQKRLDDFNALIACFSGKDKAAYDKAFSDLKALAIAKNTAKKNLDIISMQLSDINNLYNGYETIDSSISDCDKSISKSQAQIIIYQNNINSATDAITVQTSMIDNLKVQIESQKTLVAKYKAALDAAMK